MKWTVKEEELLRRSAPQGLTVTAQAFIAAYEAETDEFETLRSKDVIRKKAARDNVPMVTITDSDMAAVVDGIQTITSQLKMSREIRETGLNVGKARKILSISDLHFPFTREDLLPGILSLHKDADVVVVNGDLVEGYSYSTFSKSQNVSAVAEYRAAQLLVDHLADNFPTVILVEGNHDARLAKHLGRLGMDKNQTSFLRPSIMGRLASGEVIADTGYISALKKHDNVFFDYSEAWWVQVGKTIFAHPYKYNGSYPGGTVIATYENFCKRLGGAHFDSLVIGHCHKQYVGIVGDHLLIEQGSLSARMGYQYRDDLGHLHAVNGYAVIYQDAEGNTDFNESRAHYLGSELPPKKRIM